MVTFPFKIAVAFISLVIAVILVWLIFSVNNTSVYLKNSVDNDVESNTIQRANKFASQILSTKSNQNKELQVLLETKSIRQNCNEKLELMIDKHMRYVYLLWKDSKGKFRFLCDGSKEKSHYFQKFDSGDIDLWSGIYTAGKVSVINQTKYKGLWKTILYPVRENNHTDALLVIDYSIDFLKSLKDIIAPIKNYLYVILIAIFTLAFIVIIQFVRLFIVKRRSFMDPLTKAYNRNFLNLLQNHFKFHNYHILMIDLDYFKRINDTYGHVTGDFILLHVTKIIKAELGKKDFLVRYGGEEFLVFLNIAKRQVDGIEFANKIRLSLIDNPFVSEEFGKITVKTSIGVNRLCKDESSMEMFIKRADIALYQAKTAGRNCVVDATITDENQINLVYNFMYIKDLIDSDKVFCAYQPIIESNTNKIVKYEVLARIKDKDGKTIMPNDFLPLIWRTNAYHHFTEQIIKKSIEMFKNKEMMFTINLNLEDLLDEKIFSIIEKEAKQNPETVSRMGIEILEYDRFKDIKRLNNIINSLKSFGIKIILDDFGSGHANFLVLNNLNIDEFKIDGDMTKDIIDNTKSIELIKSIVIFALKSNIKTTVEFVSNEAKYKILSKIPITYMQGFYIGKPDVKLIDNTNLFK